MSYDYPALFRTASGGYEKAWLKCCPEGRGWEGAREGFGHETAVLSELGRLSSVPGLLVGVRTDECGFRAELPVLTLKDRRIGPNWKSAFNGNTHAVWFVMTRASGKTWEKCTFAPNHCRRPLFLLCKALRDLHQWRFGHYDLKPANIFWDETNGVLQLIDLGSAMATSGRLRDNPSTCHGDQRVGTYPWVAPEFANCRNNSGFTPEYDDYVYGLLFLQATLGWTENKIKEIFTPKDPTTQKAVPVAPDQKTRSVLYSCLCKAKVPERIAQLVVFRLLATVPQARKGALEALYGEMLELGWNSVSGRINSPPPPIPWLKIATGFLLLAVLAGSVYVGMNKYVNGSKGKAGNGVINTKPGNQTTNDSTNPPSGRGDNLKLGPEDNAGLGSEDDAGLGSEDDAGLGSEDDAEPESEVNAEPESVETLLEKWSKLNSKDAALNEMKQWWENHDRKNEERGRVLDWYASKKDFWPIVKIKNPELAKKTETNLGLEWQNRRLKSMQPIEDGIRLTVSGIYTNGMPLNFTTNVPLFASSFKIEIPESELDVKIKDWERRSRKESERNSVLSEMREWWNKNQDGREFLYRWYASEDNAVLWPQYKFETGDDFPMNQTFSGAETSLGRIKPPSRMPGKGTYDVRCSFQWKNAKTVDEIVVKVELFQFEVKFVKNPPEKKKYEEETGFFPSSGDSHGAIPAKLADTVTVFGPANAGENYVSPGIGWKKQGDTFWLEIDSCASCVQKGDDVFFRGKRIGKVNEVRHGGVAIGIDFSPSTGRFVELTNGDGFSVSTTEQIMDHWKDMEKKAVLGQMKAMYEAFQDNRQWLVQYYQEHSKVLGPVVQVYNPNGVSVRVRASELEKTVGPDKTEEFTVACTVGDREVKWNANLDLPDSNWTLGENTSLQASVNWDSISILKKIPQAIENRPPPPPPEKFSEEKEKKELRQFFSNFKRYLKNAPGRLHELLNNDIAGKIKNDMKDKEVSSFKEWCESNVDSDLVNSIDDRDWTEMNNVWQMNTGLQ